MKKQTIFTILLGCALALTGCDSKPKADNRTVTGSGTKEDPYVLYNSKHLFDLAAEANSGIPNPSSEAIYYKLGDNIDLKNKEWTPIGSIENPFKGNLDGNGYTIKNLKITQLSNEIPSIGLFGGFEGYASNLKIKNLDITVTNPQNIEEYPIIIGGFAGYTTISQIEGVTVSGKISYTDPGVAGSYSTTYDQAYIGGLVGYGEVKDNYFVSTGYCSTDVEISGSPQTAAGGLYGYLATNNYSGIYNVHDSYTTGNITGGAFVGGVVGHLSGWTSVNNVYSTSNIEATTTYGAIAGGVVGRGYYDSIIANSFAESDIKAPASSVAYKSYVGSVVGYAPVGGPEEYTLSDGTITLNNYCKAFSSVEGDVISEHYLETTSSNFKSATWVKDTLNWSSDIWNFKEGSYPTLKSFEDIETYLDATKDAKVTVTLDSNYDGGSNETIEVLKGEYDPAVFLKTATRNGFTFSGWYYDAECSKPYAPYLPISNEITLYARWQNYNTVAGTYVGSQEYNGVLVFNPDGTMQWLIYDGDIAEGTWEMYGDNWIVFETEYYPLTLASFNNGVIEFQDANADYYTYTFTKTDSMYGSWTDTNGNVFTFNGDGTGTYDNGTEWEFNYVDLSSSVQFTFTDDTFVYTVTGFVNDKNELVVNFKNDDEEYSLTFSKGDLIPDYTGEAFLGKFYSEQGWIDLESDGQAEYYGNYSLPGGFKISDDSVFQLSFNGTYGQVKYDTAKDVFYGTFKGYKVVFARSEFVKSFTTEDGSIYISVHNDETYAMSGNSLTSFEVTSGSLEDGQIVTLKIGNDIAKYSVSGSTLTEVGLEMGTFTNGTDTIVLDGVGGAMINGENHLYIMSDNKILVFSEDHYDVFALDFTNSTYTVAEKDGFSGIYYDETSSDTKDYKLEITGNGFAILYETDKGTTNWIPSNAGTCSLSNGMLSLVFERAYGLYIYTDNNVISGQIGIIQHTFCKEGYEPPVVDPSTGDAYAGTWSNGSITLTIDGQGNGQFDNGMSFEYEVTSDGINITSFNDPSYVYEFESVEVKDDNTLVFNIVYDYYEYYTWTFKRQ